MRKMLGRLVVLGVLVGAVAAVMKKMRGRHRGGPEDV